MGLGGGGGEGTGCLGLAQAGTQARGNRPSFSPSGYLGSGRAPLVLLLFSLTLFAALLVAILVQGQGQALRSGFPGLGPSGADIALHGRGGKVPEGNGVESQDSGPCGFLWSAVSWPLSQPLPPLVQGRSGERQGEKSWLHWSFRCGLLWMSNFLFFKRDEPRP